MSGRLRATIAEVARRLGGEAIEDGREDGGRYDLGGGELARFTGRATVVSGHHGDRAVLVDFFDSATLSVRVQYAGQRTFQIVPHSLLGGFLSFRRRIRSGDEAFDERFRVDHESGPPPDDLLASAKFRAAAISLAPFEEIAFGNGLVRSVALYDADSVSADEVLSRVAAACALALAAEVSRE